MIKKSKFIISLLIVALFMVSAFASNNNYSDNYITKLVLSNSFHWNSHELIEFMDILGQENHRSYKLFLEDYNLANSYDYTSLIIKDLSNFVNQENLYWMYQKTGNEDFNTFSTVEKNFRQEEREIGMKKYKNDYSSDGYNSFSVKKVDRLSFLNYNSLFYESSPKFIEIEDNIFIFA